LPGFFVGYGVGLPGVFVGLGVGVGVGWAVGLFVGVALGVPVGWAVGVPVGCALDVGSVTSVGRVGVGANSLCTWQISCGSKGESSGKCSG